MGIFRELGRQVEQLKASATAAAEGSGDHRCAACDARFEGQRERCPECGSADVEPTGTGAGAGE
ncbi:hypothetical protein ACFQPA_14660 [Halomarina halobia]|uniref:DUF35 domain-containing protein n=1 Tax=Halomarina halobia TaxID=3033386 RepID=A0ABD6A8Y8_9EURY|nr:hypothetical protein [Halomarina sp. PSR21]